MDYVQRMAEDLADRDGEAADRYAQAHESMMQEVIDAFNSGNADAPIYSPAFKSKPVTTLGDVFADATCGVGSQWLPRITALIGLTAQSADPLLRLSAQAIIAGIAREHADYHAEEADL